MLTNILLGVLVALYLFIYREQFKKFFSSDKKRYFEEKLKVVKGQIWEREFQKHQALEMREQIRLERDRALEAADAFRVELEKDHKDGTKEELQKKHTLAMENATRFEAQIKMLDNEVNGVAYRPGVAAHKNADTGEDVPEVAENPGQQGLNDIIASLVEVQKMFTSFIKTL